MAFQGTADDARTLLSNVTGTVVTVIALVLGLTVVALQLSSTQFSPRLLRSFLRDRPNQVVLSTFVATFAYSAAGLYTVGLSAGERTEDFPRLAVSGAIVLMFASLAMVVYFADHLAHSIQVDAIGKRVERDTLAVVNGRLGSVEDTDVHPTRMGGATARPDVRVCTVRASGAAVAAGLPTPGARSTSGAGRRTHRVRNGARLDVDRGPGRTRPRPGHLPARPRSRGTGRIRAHRATGRRARHSATRRHGLQGLVTGGERSLHRGPGDRPSLGDLLRPCGSPARRRRGRGPDRQGSGHRSRAAVRRLSGHDVRTHPPLRLRRTDRVAGAARAAARMRQPCWPTTRPDGPRSASRPTSFWRTPPGRPRNPPTLCPSSPPRPICSGGWHCTLPSASDSPSDSAMLNRRSSSA